jgi:acetoin utilization protein AcuB
LLDGDEVRAALVPRPGYSPEARDAFYASLAGIAALLARDRAAVVVAATANRRAYRDRARALAPRFLEVYIDVDPDECARRDAKGLYAATAAGEVRGLPGADEEYEPPDAPDVVASGGLDDAALSTIMDRVRRDALHEDGGPVNTSIPSIQEYMTRSPHSIGAGQTVGMARHLMRAHRIRHLPVLVGGKLVGVVSDRDIYWIETLKEAEGDKLPVEEAMTPAPYAVSPDAPLADVVREMAEHKYGSAVVMEGEKVVGVFTSTDAMSALAALLVSNGMAGAAR